MTKTDDLDQQPNELRRARLALRISQAEFARRLGLDQSLVSRAERGRIATWPRLRRRAAEVLGVAEDRLFPGPRP